MTVSPARSLRRAWRYASCWASSAIALEWAELHILKHEFGLLMAGWLQRAKQCDVISESAYLTLIKQFSAKGWRKMEPGAPFPQEHPRLFD